MHSIKSKAYSCLGVLVAPHSGRMPADWELARGQGRPTYLPYPAAVYGLDVLLDARTGCVPQLPEVKFAPDLTSLLKFEPSVINDVIHACFSSEEPSVKFWRLREAPTAPAFDKKPDEKPDEASIEKLPGFQELEAID